MSCSEHDRQYESGEWPPLRGWELIAAERNRQVGREGWTAEHDDEHTNGELAQSAACYAWPPPRPLWVKQEWPWARKWWKPEHGSAKDGPDRIRTLVKAGALIAAEIDRLQRAALRVGGAHAEKRYPADSWPHRVISDRTAGGTVARCDKCGELWDTAGEHKCSGGAQREDSGE